MKNYLESLEIGPDAARQYIDARPAFVELERSKKNALQYRGGMVWKTVDGKDYLIRTSTTGGQKSLGRLADVGLDDYFRVVGTHALYAYEAAAGISFASETTSTRDIDLLWDTRKRVMFFQRLAKDSPSMLAALQKVDKSFQILEDQKYTAINQNGFEVDIIRRMAEQDDPHPIRLSDAEDDFLMRCKPTRWNGC